MITINLGGKWRLYIMPNGNLPMPGTESKGGIDTGALAQTLAGIYVQASAGATRTLPLAEIIAAVARAKSISVQRSDDLKSLRESLSLSQQTCANLVHVTLNAWQKWESGERPVNKTALELFLLKTAK